MTGTLPRLDSSCHHRIHHPCSNKIRKADILVPTYPRCPGKWLIKECCCCCCCCCCCNCSKAIQNFSRNKGHALQRTSSTKAKQPPTGKWGGRSTPRPYKPSPPQNAIFCPNPSLYTSLPAPIYIYAHCLFRLLFLSIISTAYHLQSGSQAAYKVAIKLIDD